MPPDQIRRHESVHAIDPLLESRNEGDTIILTEMIATIGEFASKEGDIFALETFPEFWEGYLKKVKEFTPSFFKIFHVKNGASFKEAAGLIVSFVNKITSLRNNTDLVRTIIDCRSFSEFAEKLETIMPDWVNDFKKELQQEQLDMVLYYYQHWPDAYRMEQRAVSSLWQEESYGDQAMAAFLENNVQQGTRALDILSEATKHKFNTSNISQFNIQRKKEGRNSRITVSW